ncbi:probable helicase with zinc finger domain [Amia ocellicauda]|uniref:probable helicase with zinc finger domain n=1 Tax=Amia ocellicauda TaxID=2972642 RepID=UPI003463A634
MGHSDIGRTPGLFLPPLVHSEFARERGLQRPLLERLCALYPEPCCCRLELNEQYRTQQHIVSLVSELFYGGELRAASKQPAHKDFFPVSFFVAWGAEKSCCGYYNYAEVLEVVEQVESLCKRWPVSWGKLEEGSLGVVTTSPGQARFLRAELLQRSLHCVTVESAFTGPGRYFRVLFVSVVRTRHTYKEPVPGVGGRRRELPQEEDSVEDRELGFLSSPRMLRSVMLRAQSLLAVVGDPVALCTMGKCRRVWERYLALCHKRDSLHGATLPEILAQIDSLETSRSCMLNPLAPEFVPLSRRLPAPLPCLTNKKIQFQRFKHPAQRDLYGHAFPLGGPPCPLPLPVGRHSVYGRSPSPLPRPDPSTRSNLLCGSPYRSRLLMPLPMSVPSSGYGNCVPMDPRMMACQAAMAYNLSLLQNAGGGLSPTVLSSRSPSPLSPFRSPPDGSMELGKPGREDMRPSFGALQLWEEGGGHDRISGSLDLLGGGGAPWLSEGHMDRCSTPKHHNARPFPSPTSLGLDSPPLHFRPHPNSCRPPLLSHFDVFGRSPSPGPHGASHPATHNGGHVSCAPRNSLQGGDGVGSRMSPWMEQGSDLGSALPSRPPFYLSRPYSQNREDGWMRDRMLPDGLLSVFSVGAPYGRE